jgi:hypothetical protein
LLVLLLTVCALETPGPWGGLWLLVPLAVAGSLLVGWRYGPRGVIVPIALFVLSIVLAGPLEMWAWWVPVASLTGLWMGLREEGEGPGLGERAWTLLPILALAASLPWVLHYSDIVAKLERELRDGDAQLVQLAKRYGHSTDRVQALEDALGDQAKLRAQALPRVLPTVLFLWVATLVMAGRALGGRVAASLRWPPLSRAALMRWRLPDGALWLLIAGLALVVAQWPGWNITGWTLLLNAALGFGVQGIAVVESLLLARGIPVSIIALMFVVVSIAALPVFLLAAVAVGLSDVWLDFRSLEAAPRADVE